MSRETKKTVGDLACGQWIQFETNADLSQEDLNTAGLYKKDRFFWVMSIELEQGGYHSNLFDIDGKHFSYVSRMRTVDGVSRLRSDKVMLVEILHVVSVYGAKKTRMVYESALQYCEAVATQVNSRVFSCKWQRQLSAVFSNENARHKTFTESELGKFNLFINTPVRAQILRWIVSNLSEQQVAAEKNLPAILREGILSFQRMR